MYYYYTRWTFKAPPEGLDAGPYHSTWESEQPPKEFLADQNTGDTADLFFKQFDSREDMLAFWDIMSLNMNQATNNQKNLAVKCFHRNDWHTVAFPADVLEVVVPPQHYAGRNEWTLPALSVHVSTDAVTVKAGNRTLGRLDYTQLYCEALSEGMGHHDPT